MRIKVEPGTTRIKRLLEVLSSYSFNLYDIKGKDMILTDFLSRQKIDDSNPGEIILISFNMREVLQENYYNLYSMRIDETYLVQTRSQTKSSGVKFSEVHGIEKGLDPQTKPGRQKLLSPLMDMRYPISKPRIEQSRAGIRRKVKIVLPLQQPTPEAILPLA